MQLRLTVEYEGTAYRGWQLQRDGPTVQAVLEQALSTALRERVRVRGAGRTDAGVHACGQIAAVRVREVPADLERLHKSLNALTPDDVAVRDITVVDDAFDPRRHARSRVYEYRIWNVAAPSPGRASVANSGDRGSGSNSTTLARKYLARRLGSGHSASTDAGSSAGGSGSAVIGRACTMKRCP